MYNLTDSSKYIYGGLATLNSFSLMIVWPAANFK